jgi:hypothetical protein
LSAPADAKLIIQNQDVGLRKTNVTGADWFGWDSQTGGCRSGAPYPLSAAGINIAAPTPPELVVSVSGFFSISTNHLGNFDRGDYTFRENVTQQQGAHELHFGGEGIPPSE